MRRLELWRVIYTIRIGLPQCLQGCLRPIMMLFIVSIFLTFFPDYWVRVLQS